MHQFYESKDGQWVPCDDFLGLALDPEEEWTATLKRNGFLTFPNHTIGQNDDLQTEVYGLDQGREFKNGHTHMICFIMVDASYFFFTSDMLAFTELLFKFATICHAERSSTEAAARYEKERLEARGIMRGD